MKTERWCVTFNDGNRVVLQQETDEAITEAELLRPDGIDASEWHSSWPVGAAYGESEYLDKVKFEALRRKVGLSKSEQYAVSRWNRPESATKRHRDWLYTLAQPALAGEKIQADSNALLFAECTRLYLLDARLYPQAATRYLWALEDIDHALLYIQEHVNAWQGVTSIQEEKQICEVLDRLTEEGLAFSRSQKEQK